MYPTVTVKGSTGLLVILLVYSEVHSFIFEDEGGTDFCSRIDLHQNESTRKWLESSCNVGTKRELGDLMLSVRYNKIPREDFSRTPMVMKDRRVTQERLDRNYRTSRLSDQVRQQKVEAYRTSLSRGGNDIARNSVRNDNKRVREEKYPIRERARLNERSSSRLDKSEIQSRRSDIPASRSRENLSKRSSRFADANEIRGTRMSGNNRRLDNRAIPMRENRLAKSNDFGITRSLENQAIRSTTDEIRVSRSSENQFMESNVMRHVRSASDDAFFRSLDERRTGKRATRSVETRAMGDNRSARFDSPRNTRSFEDRAARSNEIRSTRSHDRSMENIPSRFEKNRNRRLATHYTRMDIKEGTRFLDNRIAKSDENRAAISADMRNIRLSGSHSTRSPKIRSTRSLNDAVVDSNENIRISRSAVTPNSKLERNRASRLPANDFDDNGSVRSAENRKTRLNSRSSRTIRTYGIRAREVSAVSSSKMNQLVRSPAYRHDKLGENRTTRSVESRNSIRSNDRSTRSVERSSTRSKDIESRLINEFSVRSNAKLSGVNSRSIRLNDQSMMEEGRRNMNYRTGDTLEEKIRENMATKIDKIILAESVRTILNDKTRTVNNKESARSSTRRSSVIGKTSRREPSRVVHDISSRRDNFVDADSERRSSSQRRIKSNEREEYSRFDIPSGRSDYRKRSLPKELPVRRSVQDVRYTREQQRVSAQIDDVSSSRNYRESQLSDVAGRRNFIRLGEVEARRFSHGISKAPVVTMEASLENERNSRSIVRIRLVGQTRMNSLFARIGRSRFERIREFGNDKRQRQIKSIRNIDQNRVTRDRRETLGMANLRNTFVQRRLSVTPSRFQNNNNVRTKYERSRDIMRDMETRSALPTQQISRLGENKMETAVPTLSLRKIGSGHRQHDQRMVERNSIDNRVRTRKTDEGESTNSHRTRLEYRREVFGVSDMPRVPATYTKNGIVRSIDNVRERWEYDETRTVQRIAATSGRRGYSKIDRRNLNKEIRAENADIQKMNHFISERESFLDLERKTENYRSGRTHDNFKKMEAKEDSYRKGLFGISTNTALQVTLASILVGQLIFSKLGSSKGNYCTANWMGGLKSF